MEKEFDQIYSGEMINVRKEITNTIINLCKVKGK